MHQVKLGPRCTRACCRLGGDLLQLLLVRVFRLVGDDREVQRSGRPGSRGRVLPSHRHFCTATHLSTLTKALFSQGTSRADCFLKSPFQMIKFFLYLDKDTPPYLLSQSVILGTGPRLLRGFPCRGQRSHAVAHGLPLVGLTWCPGPRHIAPVSAARGSVPWGMRESSRPADQPRDRGTGSCTLIHCTPGKSPDY